MGLAALNNKELGKNTRNKKKAERLTSALLGYREAKRYKGKILRLSLFPREKMLCIFKLSYNSCRDLSGSGYKAPCWVFFLPPLDACVSDGVFNFSIELILECINI